MQFQHDGTVTALMYAMGVGNGQLTPYASAVMLELYQNDQNGFEVGVFFRNDSYAEQPIELQIPGCGGNICTLEAFALSLQSVMYRTRSDYNRDCGLPEEGTTPTFFVSTTSGGSTQKAAQTADDQNRVPGTITNH
uniref:Uncharacterized protein n=1 Tax=Plectus sambesii TaxID=2011161 RepID=A0A914X8H7_9BILA